MNQPHSYVRGDPRPLRVEEFTLIDAMLRARNSTNQLLLELDGLLVQDMNDGGMGSLRVWTDAGNERRFGSVAAEAEFNDADGTLVLASIYLDHEDRLYELDIWKVDFSPLRKLPAPGNVRFDPLGQTDRINHPAPGSGGKFRPR